MKQFLTLALAAAHASDPFHPATATVTSIHAVTGDEALALRDREDGDGILSIRVLNGDAYENAKRRLAKAERKRRRDQWQHGDGRRVDVHGQHTIILEITAEAGSPHARSIGDYTPTEIISTEPTLSIAEIQEVYGRRDVTL